MGKFKNLIICIIVIAFCVIGVAFIFGNTIYNSADKPTNGVDHHEGGGSHLRNWHWSVNTPDFVTFFGNVGNHISSAATNAQEGAEDIVDKISKKAQKDSVEFTNGELNTDEKDVSLEETKNKEEMNGNSEGTEISEE